MQSIKQLVEQVVSNKGIVVTIGLGTTGKSVVQYFAPHSVSVIAIEKLSHEKFIANAANRKFLQGYEQKNSETSKVSLCFEDKIPESTLKKLTTAVEQKTPVIAVISPGIARTSVTATKIRSLNIPLIGELELALNLIDVPSVMVTGSNGKSTTVSIIDEILRRSGIDSFLCGNIGQPVLEVLKASSLPKVLVVEASSYQLESADSIRPKVAVFLNITDNHLERHVTIDNYRTAKLKMFGNQTKDDFAILNKDDPQVYSAKEKLSGQIGVFGFADEGKIVDANFSLVTFAPETGSDFIDVAFAGQKRRFDCKDSSLIGEHTRLNLSAAILASLAVGAKMEAIQSVINDFQGLVHRLQKVSTKSNLFAINDSKSTTVASTVAAYNSIRKNFPHRPICLLVGGKMKIGSWEPLTKAILSDPSSSMTRVICFGGDGAIILQELENRGIVASLGRNVSEAVSLSCDWVRDDEIILFSPGCASFDEFSNFEQRGEFFSRLIKER